MTAGTGTSTLSELEGMFAKLQKFMQPPADVDLTGTEPPVDSTAALWLRFKQFDEDGKDHFDARDLKRVLRRLGIEPSAAQLRALMRRLLGGVEGSVVRFGRFCEIARVDDDDDVSGGMAGARYATWLQKAGLGGATTGMSLDPQELERRVRQLLKQRVGKAGSAVHARRAF